MIDGPLTSGPWTGGSQTGSAQTGGPWTGMIDLRGLTKVYQTPVGPFRALKGIDLEVAPGEFVAVVGKSGSGKTTLINMITGIDRPTAGEIIVGGTPVHTLNESGWPTGAAAAVGVVFQFFQLLPTLTVAENVMLPMDFCSMSTAHANATSARCTCWSWSGSPTRRTSCPQPSRAGSSSARRSRARSRTTRRSSWPTSRPATWTRRRRRRSSSLFERLAAAGKTILMVTHDDDLAERARGPSYWPTV